MESLLQHTRPTELATLHRSNNPKDIKMTKSIALFLPAILMISVPLPAASPKSDGYYGKTKVAPKAQVKASPASTATIGSFGNPVTWTGP